MTDRRIPLLDVDPELGRLLDAQRHARARRELLVTIAREQVGRWDGGPWNGDHPRGFGLLLLDGLVARELEFEDNVSCELLGPGDVLRSPEGHDSARAMGAEGRWVVLEQAELGVLDSRVIAALAHYPEVNAMLIDRLAERTHRLATGQAISRLTGVDRRLLALFWHLAERWGKVGRDGVTVTLPVPNRILAELVGARPPTVSTALGTLAEQGMLTRDGHTWLLSGDPVGLPTAEAARVIRARRSATRPDGASAEDPADLAPATRVTAAQIATLRETLGTLWDDNARYRNDFQDLLRRSGDLLAEMNRRRERR